MLLRVMILGLCISFASSAVAKTPLNASCADFLAAPAEDVPLFNGIALGLVAARTGYSDQTKAMFEAERVLHLAKGYCAKKPSDPVIKVFDFWSAFVKKYPFPETGNN